MGYVDNDDASDTAYSNTTSGLAAANVQTAIDLLAGKLNSTSTGISPFYQFTTYGALGVGSYLSVGMVPSNQVGQLIPGVNKITKMAITCSQVLNGTAVIQLAQRTAVSTISDITGAALTFAGNNTAYKASIIFSTPISLSADTELVAYFKSSNSGGSLQNPVLLVFAQPN